MTEPASPLLFGFPEQARVGRVLPKAKVYEHARVTGTLRDKFVSQIEQITWAWKLAPETIRLAASPAALEIQVFDIALKGDELDEEVLRAIDRAIPHPILFQLQRAEQVRLVAAYKRPSQTDVDKWVLDGYLFGPWLAADTERQPLPPALDLYRLYEQLLRSLLALPARSGESLADQLARLNELHRRQNEYRKLETHLHRERQFNRKVALNAELRELKKDIDRLSA